MIGIPQLHWNMLEWVDPKSTPKRVKPFSVSSKKFYINNNDRTALIVGHSKLTPLDIVDFIKKQINERLETEMKETDEKLGKNAFLEDDNFDEVIPIQIIKERRTEAYKDKMNKDIETIDKNDNSKQIVQKTKWRPIYEVIDEDYIKKSNIFPDAFIKKCKQCPNKPQTILGEVKNSIKLMEMEQTLYA